MNKSIFSINSLSKYSDLFQIVGVIGLIASLIFVGLEMRQSHKIALSDQHLARAQVWVGVYNTATSNSIAHQYDQNHYSNFDVHSHNSFHAMWNIFEADYLRYRLGLMTDDAWQGRLNSINSIRKFLKKFKKNIKLIKGDTNMTLKQHDLSNIDFAFIDGGHSSETTYHDLSTLYSYMKNKSKITLCDDYIDATYITEVKTAVDDFVKKNNLKIQIIKNKFALITT